MVDVDSTLDTSRESGDPVAPRLLDIIAQVQRSDAAVPRNSATFEAALLLAAAVRIGQNVDRLARFTAIRRDVVARAARRLVDNGVWRAGNTLSPWVDNPAETVSFWADAAVAEGKLCRRIGDDGELEWAPQGYWRKHYEYVASKQLPSSNVVLYHSPVERTGQDVHHVVEEEDEDESGVATVSRAPSHSGVMAPDSAMLPAGGPIWLGDDVGDSQQETVAVAAEVDDDSPAMFPDAVWLG